MPADPALELELEFGDGTRLVLEDAAARDACRLDGETLGCFTLADAMRRAGGRPFAGYRVRE